MNITLYASIIGNRYQYLKSFLRTFYLITRQREIGVLNIARIFVQMCRQTYQAMPKVEIILVMVAVKLILLGIEAHSSFANVAAG